MSGFLFEVRNVDSKLCLKVSLSFVKLPLKHSLGQGFRKHFQEGSFLSCFYMFLDSFVQDYYHQKYSYNTSHRIEGQKVTERLIKMQLHTLNTFGCELVHTPKTCSLPSFYPLHLIYETKGIKNLNFILLMSCDKKCCSSLIQSITL